MINTSVHKVLLPCTTFFVLSGGRCELPRKTLIPLCTLCTWCTLSPCNPWPVRGGPHLRSVHIGVTKGRTSARISLVHSGAALRTVLNAPASAQPVHHRDDCDPKTNGEVESAGDARDRVAAAHPPACRQKVEWCCISRTPRIRSSPLARSVRPSMMNLPGARSSAASRRCFQKRLLRAIALCPLRPHHWSYAR